MIAPAKNTAIKIISKRLKTGCVEKYLIKTIGVPIIAKMETNFI